MRVLMAAAVTASAAWCAAQEPLPAFELPLAFPAEPAQAVLSRTAPASASNGVPIAFLAALADGVWGGDTNNLAAALPVPAGASWISFGFADGAWRLRARQPGLTVPHRPELDFSGRGGGPAAFTVSAWVWMEDATWFTMAAKGEGREWLFGFDRRDRLGLILGADDPKHQWALWSEPLTADERAWHHYAVSVEQTGSAPKATLYRDGVPLAATVEAPKGAYAGLRPLGGPLVLGSGPQVRTRTLGALGGLEVRAGAASADAIRDSVARDRAAEQARGRVETLELEAAFPGEREIELWNWRPWHEAESLQFGVALPADAPTNCEALIYVKDWDWLWYQHLAPAILVPGTNTPLTVTLAAESDAWTPVGHDRRWNFRTLADPRNVGIRIFCKETAWTGRVSIVAPQVRLRPPATEPPAIRDVRPLATRVPRDDRFEVSFRLPDRHLDPFDTNSVHVAAAFTAPDGTVTEVDGFYANDFYREATPAGERIVPQGGPLWRVRFAPRQEGVYTYTLSARDAAGATVWGPGSFTAGPAVGPGFVRVSARDPRSFEFTDGRFYFPIGHNIRSPFDTRHDGAFPWMQRFDAGTAVYERYFRDMAAVGEQWAEVWFAPWSLGLEWDERWAGYHGIGQYNMRHAWEMDRVLDEAARHGILVNLVIHNHGKFSLFSDREFVDNPFNVDNGGYLQTPEEYFSDPRALESFRKLMRYTIARWGYSRQIFAWELWSEFDLVGSQPGFYKKPVCVEWHRMMSRFITQLDPNRHLVSSHVCSDYSRQDPNLIALPEMDLCPVDAYHHKGEATAIVPLMKVTAAFNNPYAKPVQITEFGGSPFAADMNHLRAALHAGVWGSVGVALGGTPMFWWWMAIEEENLYPVFRGVARFMEGVDRRDPALLPADPAFSGGAPAGELLWTCLRSPRLALGWVARTPEFQTVDLAGPARVTGLTATLAGVADGTFAVEYWDTITGAVAKRETVTAAGGVLPLAWPPFVRDAAFKARRMEP